MRSDRERLRDMLDAIEAVKKYAAKGRAAFDTEELIQTWTVHHLMLFGEAAAGLSDAFCEKHLDVPWFKIVGMRNVLIHGYFAIDKEIVWSVVENDLPKIERRIRAWLTEQP
ncbi:MAG: DUF86 domain-containing protein [Sedimentisphaerales bacterium]|nr:DUF86 domain-containing protein [Sedimentisphaerales bacterium]